MNPILRMIHALTGTARPAKHDPVKESLRDEVVAQRSRHAAAETQTRRTAATVSLIESYRQADSIMFRRKS